MSGPVGLKIGARIELTLVKGCPKCSSNQFYVVAATPGDPPESYWLVCAVCGNKGSIPYWPFELRAEPHSTITITVPLTDRTDAAENSSTQG